MAGYNGGGQPFYFKTLKMKQLGELLVEVDRKEVWNRVELREKIRKKIDEAENGKPRVVGLNNYDFFGFSIKHSIHPCVIFRMEEECVWAIVASSNEGACHNIAKIENSRYLSQGWWTATIVCVPKTDAYKYWMGIFDNPDEVRRAVKLLGAHYKTLLK